jgi:hypothetical protein
LATIPCDALVVHGREERLAVVEGLSSPPRGATQCELVEDLPASL